MNEKQNQTPTKRLEVVDALRGFALLAIVLLHNLEHYNIFHYPEWQPKWLSALDTHVWAATFFMLAGKAFATFSLLFGFSFFIQMDNQARLGNDFRARFAWRLLMLLLFAQLHALFYNGDILLLYAVCGFLLIPVAKLPNKVVLLIAVVLLLQPFDCYRMVHALLDPSYQTSVGNLFMEYSDRCQPVTQNGGWLEVLASNITDGQLYGNVWQIENGRLFQIPGLFMLGMLLGRMRFFVKSECSVRFWRRSLVGFLILFAVILAGKAWLAPVVSSASGSFQVAYGVAVGTYQSFCLMAVLVSVFVLCWFRVERGYRFQRALIPYGKMSLTNYITQSIIGCTVYYGYGLGLWNKTGATLCLLIGVVIFFVQLSFSRYWLARHKQGPLEYLWKRLTWIKLSSK